MFQLFRLGFDYFFLSLLVLIGQQYSIMSAKSSFLGSGSFFINYLARISISCRDLLHQLKNPIFAHFDLE